MNKVPTDWCLRELFSSSWKNLLTLSSQDRSAASLESPLQRQDSHSGHLITTQWPHLLTLTLWRPEFQCLNSEQINTYSTVHTIFLHVFMGFKYPWRTQWVLKHIRGWSCACMSAFALEGVEVKMIPGVNSCTVSAVQQAWCQTFNEFKSWCYLFLAMFSWTYKQLSLQWIKMASLQWVAPKTNWINVLKQLQFFLSVRVCVW